MEYKGYKVQFQPTVSGNESHTVHLVDEKMPRKLGKQVGVIGISNFECHVYIRLEDGIIYRHKTLGRNRLNVNECTVRLADAVDAIDKHRGGKKS